MPSMTLDTADAAELAEMLSFLGEWLTRDPAVPAHRCKPSWGNPACGIQQLRDDIDRLSSCSATATASNFTDEHSQPGEEGP
jgi:hypothetical protein